MKISIIGASGIVGSCTAFTIASQGLADEIVMLGGERSNVAANHAMDLQAAMSGRKDMVVRSGKYPDIAGSDIAIIAAGVHFPANTPAPQKLIPNIPILKTICANIESLCPQAVVITVTNPVDLMNYAVYLCTSLDRHKLIGFNLNDTTRFRMALARAFGISAARVDCQVLGAHPQSPVLVFSSVKVDGQPYAVDASIKKKVQDELQNYLHAFEALDAGRSAGWTSATGLAAMVRAIVENNGQVLPCSAVLNGEYGWQGLSVGVPAQIGRSGIRQIVEMELGEDERVEMNSVARVLTENVTLVRRLTGSKRS
jgi:malate dehydrogenase